MPEISRFFGVVIKMFFDDDDRHHKPHIHVFYGDYRASVAIDGELLAGALPTKQYRLVSGWLALHENELYSLWNKAVAGEPLDSVEPLR